MTTADGDGAGAVNIQRILCPIDFSDGSRHALEHAVAFAEWYEAQITVLHTYTTPQPVVPAPGMPGDIPVLPPLQSQEVLVEEVRRFCKSVTTGRSLEIVVNEGRPASKIVQQAEQMPADLLVMGTHGRGGFERLFLGSVTEKVLRTTRRPVLAVSPPVQGPVAGPLSYKAILCPVDFSEASTRALEYALSLAKEADARLILLHVVEGVIDAAHLSEAAHFSVPEYHRYLEQDAITRLKAAVPAEARVSCKPEERVSSGRAYREILKTAAQTEAELIVMGVHGKSAVNRLLFGSTTHHVIREAACPVLTLRA
jgi:nucleotide-binding universal stress UspA family protein